VTGIGSRESLVGKTTEYLIRCSSVPLSPCVHFLGNRISRFVTILHRLQKAKS